MTGLDRFRALLLADEALQMELARCDRTDRFVEAALAIAGRHDISLAPEDLEPFVNPDPLGLNRPDGVTVASPDWPSPHFLPIRAVEGIGVEWAHFAGAPLAQPFYTESARRALARPLNQLIRYRTALDEFVGNARVEESLVPDGFIFHMSRCGSTLVSQMLAALPGTILVSEAAPLDSIVELGAPEALRAMVAALGRPRAGESRYIVKLNASHVLALPLFRRAFPDVPWLFLFRDPAQVLASQLRQRGAELAPQFVPSRYYGIADGMSLPPPDYCALVLARICAAAVEHEGLGGGLFVDYADLPGAVVGRVLPHFGLAADAAGRDAMAAVTANDAKAPERPFDGAATLVPAQARDAADRHLASVHRRLAAIAARA